jgi:hypothetical protein
VDLSFEQVDLSFEQVDLSPEQVDLSPEQVDLSPEQVDLSPEQVDLSPEQVDLSPEQVDLSPEQLDLSPEQLDLSPAYAGLKSDPIEPPAAPESQTGFWTRDRRDLAGFVAGSFRSRSMPLTIVDSGAPRDRTATMRGSRGEAPARDP